MGIESTLTFIAHLTVPARHVTNHKFNQSNFWTKRKCDLSLAAAAHAGPSVVAPDWRTPHFTTHKK